MDDAQLGGVVRALRHRRGWRQADLAAKAGVSPSAIGLIEHSQLERLSLRTVRRVARALDIRMQWDVGYRGAELGRLLDANHALLAESLTRILEAGGWSVIPEASFNRFGDRGRIDLLAYHAATRMLLVIEIKTVIAEIQDLLGKLSVYRRVAPDVARQLGWRPTHVTPLLVIAEGTTNRRRVAAHQRLFAPLAVRGSAARAWLRRPEGTPGGVLLFVDLPDHKLVGVRRAGRQRVRLAHPQLSVEGSPQWAPETRPPA